MNAETQRAINASNTPLARLFMREIGKADDAIRRYRAGSDGFGIRAIGRTLSNGPVATLMLDREDAQAIIDAAAGINA